MRGIYIIRHLMPFPYPHYMSVWELKEHLLYHLEAR
mgnify:CR=1 FL=1